MSSREQYDAAQDAQYIPQTAADAAQKIDDLVEYLRALPADVEIERGQMIKRMRQVSARNEQLRAANEQLRAALEDALEEMQCMIGYVDEYSRDKWELDASIERVRAALEDK